jgi:hypothetical protein
MEPVPSVGWGFFPLDEQLGLATGSLTPMQEEHLVHFATWMPFAHAAQMLESLTGVQVSEATVRRHTQHAGQVCEQVQNEQSRGTSRNESSEPQGPSQIVLSADGAFVPLLAGIWA